MKGIIIVILALVFVCEVKTDKTSLATQPNEKLDDSSWACLARNGTVAQFSVYLLNAIDQGFISNLHGIRAAGFATIEGYIALLPAYNGAAPIPIMLSQLQAQLNQSNLTLQTLYLVLDEVQGGWYSDTTKNFNYLQNLVKSAQTLGMNVGFYAYQQMWETLIGDNWDDSWTNLPVWYVGKDADKNFNDWSAAGFGKFPQPALKAIQGGAMCGASSIALSWSP